MKNIVSSLLLIAITTFLSAQAIDDHEIEVLKDYNDEIYAALPIYDFNSIRLPDQSSKGVLNDTLVHLGKYTPQMAMSVKPLAFKRNRIDRGYNGFLKADKGTQQLLGMRAGYTHYVENYYSIGIEGTYDYWKDPNLASKYHKEISGAMSVDYYLNKSMKASLKIGGESQDWGRYGFAETNTTDEIGRNAYMNHQLALGFSSFETNHSSLSYQASLRVQSLTWNDEDIEENNLAFDAGVAYRLDDQNAFSFKGHVYRSKLNEANTLNVGRGVLSYRLNTRAMDLTIGGSALTAGSVKRIFPNIDLHVTIDQTEIVGVLEENIQSINLNHILGQNPYINPFQLESFNSIYRKLGVGVKSRVKEIGFQIDGEYVQVDNGYNFINSIIDRQQFMVSTLNYNLVQSSVRANYHLKPFNVGLRIQHNLVMNNEDNLYHLPNLIFTPFAQYATFDSRLLIEIRGEVNTGQDLGIAKTGILESGWRRDVSAQIRFSAHERLNVYFNADNILNDTYQIYNGYAVFGRNISAGLMLKF